MFVFTDVDCLGWSDTHAVLPFAVEGVAGRGGGEDVATAATALRQMQKREWGMRCVCHDISQCLLTCS
jgi:hypothetical protein